VFFSLSYTALLFAAKEQALKLIGVHKRFAIYNSSIISKLEIEWHQKVMRWRWKK
jgi:hypothetical protein